MKHNKIQPLTPVDVFGCVERRTMIYREGGNEANSALSSARRLNTAYTDLEGSGEGVSPLLPAS